MSNNKNINCSIQEIETNKKITKIEIPNYSWIGVLDL